MINELAIEQLKQRLLLIQSNYKEGTSGHNCFGIAANLCNEYKEEEKQHIVNAFTAGQISIAKVLAEEINSRELNCSITINDKEAESDKEDGLEYYNNYFNQHH